jgi:hypothetical protein
MLAVGLPANQAHERNAVEPMTPADSPMTLHEVVASEQYRDLSTAKLKTGDLAFPFVLPKLAGYGKAPETGEMVALIDYAGVRPVALIFGSYT